MTYGIFVYGRPGVSVLLTLLGLVAGTAPPPAAATSRASVPVRAASVPATAPVSVAAVAASVPVAAVLASVPAVALAAPVSTFRWPLDGEPRLVRGFDPPAQPWLAGHRGVDLAAAPSTLVRTAGRGVVLFAGRIAGRGVVSVGHPGGLRTTYEPVEPRVVTGQRLDTGQPIGVLAAGHPGCPAAACLHWGLRRGPVYLDPLVLLGLGRVRLLPI